MVNMVETKTKSKIKDLIQENGFITLRNGELIMEIESLKKENEALRNNLRSIIADYETLKSAKKILP